MNELSVNLMRYRKLSGLTQQALAEGAGISRVAYRNLEKGLSEPRESTLQALAAVLNISLLDLFSPVPKLKSLRFRANKMSEQERAECDQVVVRCAEWLQDFNELETLLNKQPHNLLKTIRKGNEPQKTAQAARRKLAQHSNCDCIEDICELLESAGIKVLLYPSKVKSFFGLSIGAADGGPAIAVNTAESISVERQIFSMAHELGHLILHKDSYGPDGVAEICDEAQEREADAFAAAFLMPSDLFDQVWKETRGLHWVDAVLKTKRHFKVSYQSVLHQVKDLDKAERQVFYEQFRNEYKNRYDKSLHRTEEPRGLDPLDLMEDRLGILVRDALDAELITVGRAAEILNISIEEIRDQLRSWEVFS